MCTVVILRRPGHPWPVLLAANRDEMRDRPWRPPDRHWPDRPDAVAGLDELAGGTWLALNDHGVVAGILNRPHELGPAPDKRSRGELPLEAVDHADAADAVEALSQLDGRAYRPFNMIVADNRDAWWLRNDPERTGGRVEMFEVPAGVSLLTAHDLNDTASSRIARYLPRFRAAADPLPETGDWKSWTALLTERGGDESLGPDEGPRSAMAVDSDIGFGTVSSSLIALPAPQVADTAARAVWLFAAGMPAPDSYAPVEAVSVDTPAGIRRAAS